MNDDLFLMWLNRIDGVGNKRQRLLLETFGSGEAVFYAPRNKLNGLYFLDEQLIHKILSMQDAGLLKTYESELQAANMRFLPMSSAEYPCLLKLIHEPPAGIYVVGELPPPDLPSVSIIGSRKCSEYGLSTAFRFSKELAAHNVVIVSGMARGVDSMAHRGAIESDGFTVAVLGCGADVCYPPENRALMEKIKKKGCIVSEYPPGTKPLPGYFPTRNRIISGLTMGTVVVEASERSGTLITVDNALDEGRDVMAVPGNITSKLSIGTNELIKQGATPVTSCEDILRQLNIEIESENNGNSCDEKKNNKSDLLAPEEKMVYALINFEPIAIEALIIKLNSRAEEINYLLTLLEMKKAIKKLPGQRVVRL